MNQNTILVNLPATVLQDPEMTVTIDYSGRLEPQAPEREDRRARGTTRPGVTPPEDDVFIQSRRRLLSTATELLVSAGDRDRLRDGDDSDHGAVAYSCVASGEQRSTLRDGCRRVHAAHRRKLYAFCGAAAALSFDSWSPA
jgi:hypothetical protein